MNWYCPSCLLEHRTTDPLIAQAYHACPNFGGLTTPFVVKGYAAKIEAREREDYIGQEQVRLTDGRPVMSLITTRDNGQDVTVFAPTASLHGQAHLRKEP